MLDRDTLTGILAEMKQEGEFDALDLDSTIELTIARFAEQATQNRQGLSYSRAYFIVTFAYVAWLKQLLRGGDLSAVLTNVTDEGLEALRLAVRGPLVNERRSMKAGAGSFRVVGNVTPEVLSSFRSTLAAIGNACSQELHTRRELASIETPALAAA